MLSFILILYKLDDSYICPLDKSVMSRHTLNTMFATLGQIAAEILVIFLGIPPYFSVIFILILMFSLIFMNMKMRHFAYPTIIKPTVSS